MDLFGTQSVPDFPVRRFEPEKTEFVSRWTPRRKAAVAPAVKRSFSLGRFVKASTAAQGLPVKVQDAGALSLVAATIRRAR